MGNTRVVYQPLFCGEEVLSYDVKYVGDYFPYAKTIREYVKGKKEKFLTTHHQRDEETGLDYRGGARFYDSDIARFLSLDPLAADFASWSPYNYVLGNPVILVDPDGQAPEGPIYGEYGKLIGYIVEAGQGPTQIAQDLNQNYRCELSCDAEFTQIVYDNSTQFQNVFDGKGNIEDKYNGNYKFGNIKAGDVLLITNGKTTEAEKITERIESKSKAVDSFLESKEKIYDEIKFQESIPKSGIYILMTQRKQKWLNHYF